MTLAIAGGMTKRPNKYGIPARTARQTQRPMGHLAAEDGGKGKDGTMRQVSTISVPMLEDVLLRTLAILREHGYADTDVIENLISVQAAVREAADAHDDIVFPYDPDVL